MNRWIPKWKSRSCWKITFLGKFHSRIWESSSMFYCPHIPITEIIPSFTADFYCHLIHCEFRWLCNPSRHHWLIIFMYTLVVFLLYILCDTEINHDDNLHWLRSILYPTTMVISTPFRIDLQTCNLKNQACSASWWCHSYCQESSLFS